ncbi:enoyl-CoA hydratase/isomerase family protein [Elusimicrobiota bacterium]
MIKTTDDAGIRSILMERPPSNVLSLDLMGALSEAFKDAAGDPGVRCVLLGSALPKYFSAGLDLDEIMSLPQKRRLEPFRTVFSVHRQLAGLPKPTIAVIDGTALLGGWIVAMGCDFRWMCSEKGRIALSEVRLGLSPTSPLISRLCAMSKDPTLVKELVLQGRTLKSEQALRGGFVDRLAPSAELMSEAMREARSLAKLAPKAYAAVKRDLNAANGLDDDSVWDKALEGFRGLLDADEAREGLTAQHEKRKPRWD